MASRYVYWRDGTGKPYKRDDDSPAPTALLAEIGRLATINDKGEITWRSLRIHQFELAVCSAIVVRDQDGHELNDADTSSIALDAIISVIKKHGGNEPVAPKDVINEANRLAAEHFRRSVAKVAEYVLLSSLSIAEFPATRIRVRDCEILPLKGRGTRFPYPGALTLQASQTPIAQHIKSTQYKLVKVKTAGRSTHEAVDKALAALNLLRGFWTLAATYGSWSIHFGMRPPPIGVIHIGPVHTLHDPDGTPAENAYWSESDYTGDQEIFRPKKGWAAIEKTRKWAIKRVKRLPYRTDIEELIIRYVGALDYLNLDIAFLQMWSILEKLTDTVGARYDETIRRAIRFHPDRKKAREMLQSLRFRRNQFVHAAKSGQDRDQAAYMIKSFVEPHLLRLIDNPQGFQSLKEYGEYLGLPTDIETLEQRQRHLRWALKESKK